MDQDPPQLPPPQGARRRGRVFLNPDGSSPGEDFRQVFRLLRAGRGTPWPRRVEDPPQPAPSPPPPGHLAVTFVGHSTFLLRYADGTTLLTDPIWSPAAGMGGQAGVRRVRKPALPFDALPRVDAVLLSHNHYDHMDLPTLRRLRDAFGPRILTGLGNAAYLARAGLRDVVELDWWGEAPLPGGRRAVFLPARHFSARGLFDRGHTLWGGFAVLGDADRILFAGDTAWGAHFAEIGARVGPFDLALLPIGAYRPRWFMDRVHIDPGEAVRARADLRVRRAIAMHFGSFKLTQEGIDDPPRELAEARRIAGLAEEDFAVPVHGATVMVPLSAPA